MRYTHLGGLFIGGWLLCTVHGIGYAQPVRTGDLPPEVQTLLKELRGGQQGSTGLSELATPSPGAVLEHQPGAATSDGYEQTLLRYLALQKLATQTAVDHATALERQLQTLETELAGADARSPQPLEAEEAGDALVQRQDEYDGFPGLRPSLPLPLGEGRGEGPQRLVEAPHQLLQDYDRLTQRLEELAASSRAMAQRLRDLLR